MILPEDFAVMAVDPGSTTGLAWGEFRGGPESVAQAFESARLGSRELSGPVGEQARAVVERFEKFAASRNIDGIALPNIHLVMEDFALRSTRRLSQREALDPVRIAGGVAALTEFEFGFQQPSEAKGYATNERLRRWGLWVRGSEHRRDANRHLALKVSKLLG